MMDKDRFIEEYIANNGNGVQAVLATGFSGTYGAARVKANRLLTNDNIRREIEKRESEIRRKMRIETELTREDLIGKFQVIHDEGIATGKLQAAIKALENIGKMIGAYGEDNKQKGSGSLGAALAEMVKLRQVKQIESEVRPALESGIKQPDNPEWAGVEGETGGGVSIKGLHRVFSLKFYNVQKV